MKRIAFVFIAIAFISCQKEKNKWITGTVTQFEGCSPNTWLVKLDNPQKSRHPFLCDPSQAMISSSTVHCGNSVVILNLPAALNHPGTQIKFSQWTDKGLLCFSSTLAPHHLEVSDVSAK